MGTWYAQVVVFNQSPVDCLLLASAPVEVRDGRGQLLLTSQALNDPTASVVVPAQATVVGNLGLAGWCAAPPVEPLRAAIVLGSASLPISGIRGGPVIDVPGCPGEPGASIESQLFYETPFQSPGPPPEPSPFDPGDSLPFNAIAAVPSSAEPGQAMDYTVTLVNTSIYGKPINLSAECPSYVEKLYLPGTRTPIESRYLLNCGPAGIMQVGERRTFAMRVDIPADAPSGTATIVWQLGWAGAGDKVQLVIP